MSGDGAGVRPRAGAGMAHRARLSAPKRIDAGLLGWNCAMLFFAALTPLPTSMLFGRSYSSPVPPVFYALAMSCTWLCLNGMWRHAWRAGLMAHDVSARTYRGALLSTLPTTAVFLVSVPFAFIPGVQKLLQEGYLVHAVVRPG